MKAQAQTGSGVKGARRRIVMGVRVTREERAELRRRAAAAGVSLSVWLRGRIFGERA